MFQTRSRDKAKEIKHPISARGLLDNNSLLNACNFSKFFQCHFLTPSISAAVDKIGDLLPLDLGHGGKLRIRLALPVSEKVDDVFEDLHNILLDFYFSGGIL